MSAKPSCSRNSLILALLGFLAVLASFLFSNLLRDVLIESLDQESPPVPEDCISPIIITSVTLSGLSLLTFPFLMFGIQKLKTWMVLPWTLVTGFQTLAGGVLLWYLVFQTATGTLVQCLSLYSMVAYGFIGITFCYYKIKLIHDANKQKLDIAEDKVRILAF